MTRLRRLGKVQMLAQAAENILCMAVRVLLILAGRPTVNLQK